MLSAMKIEGDRLLVFYTSSHIRHAVLSLDCQLLPQKAPLGTKAHVLWGGSIPVPVFLDGAPCKIETVTPTRTAVRSASPPDIHCMTPPTCGEGNDGEYAEDRQATRRVAISVCCTPVLSCRLAWTVHKLQPSYRQIHKYRNTFLKVRSRNA